MRKIFLPLLGLMLSAAPALGVYVQPPYPFVNGGTNNSSAYTNQSVIFSNGTSLTQDNANFLWNDSTDELFLGVGGTTGIILQGTGAFSASVGALVCDATGDITTTGTLGIGSASAPTANFQIKATSTTKVQQIIQGIASQTADYFDIQDSTGANVLDFTKFGLLGINKISPAAMIEADSNGVSQPNMILKEIASQTADVLDIENSSNTKLFNVSAAGNIGVATAVATAGIGLNYALPAASASVSTGLNLSETGVVFPQTARANYINLISDTTSYGATSGNSQGSVIAITNSKPVGSTLLVETNTGQNISAINNANVTVSAGAYSVYGTLTAANTNSAVSSAVTGTPFITRGGYFTGNNSSTFTSSGTNTVQNIGLAGIAADTVTASAGTVTATDYGVYGLVQGTAGSANLTTTGYGVYASASGDTINYDFYSASGNPSYFSGLLEFNTHLYATQTGAITITSCGTGSAVTSGANDVRGNISVGTLATSCQVNFISAYLSVPYCVITPTNSTASGLYVSATTMSNFTVSGTTIASASFNYQCIR